PALQQFAEFLWLDENLLEVAAENSIGELPRDFAPAELDAWIAGLPEAEKNDLLGRLLKEEAAAVRLELLHRFREARKRSRPAKAPAGQPPRRTVGALLEAAERREEERRRRAAAQQAEEKARRELEKAAARAQRFDALAAREAEA